MNEMNNEELLVALRAQGEIDGAEAVETLRRKPWLNRLCHDLPGPSQEYVAMETEAERRGLIAPFIERQRS